MIEYIKGELVELTPALATIETAGIGYGLNISLNTFSAIQRLRVGDETSGMGKTLSWPDGSTDVIHYHCSDHREGKNPRCNRSWKLNGQPHEGSHFHFTGKSLE